jgi:hypothetical protein
MGESNLLIIEEGSDGGGKTALANTVRDAWLAAGNSPGSVQITHKGPPDDPHSCPFLEYEVALDREPLNSFALSLDKLLILDRWHIGDKIYGPRYRGYARYTPAGMLHTELALSSLGAVKVLCSPPLETVQKRVADRGDDYIDQEDLPRIHAEYITHAETYGYYFIDGLQDQDSAVKHLLSDTFFKTGVAQSLAAASAGTYTGPLFPYAVFVGDELGGNALRASGRFGEYMRPFTPVTPDTSSEWLLDAFLKCGIVNTAGLVNAHHPGVNLAALAKLLPGARWVALGARASTALDGFGIEHARVHHPQFERRFRHTYHDEYAARLAEAAGMER